MKKILLILLLGITCAIANQDFQSLLNACLENNTCDKMLENYQVFDIRTKEEWEEFGVVKNAVLLEFLNSQGAINADFLDNFAKLADKDKEIVLVCRSGSRTNVAKDLIKQNLNINTISLKGGTRFLTNKGYTLTPLNTKEK